MIMLSLLGPQFPSRAPLPNPASQYWAFMLFILYSFSCKIQLFLKAQVFLVLLKLRFQLPGSGNQNAPSPLPSPLIHYGHFTTTSTTTVDSPCRTSFVLGCLCLINSSVLFFHHACYYINVSSWYTILLRSLIWSRFYALSVQTQPQSFWAGT